MKVLRTTHLLVVDAIEPHLAVWTGALGFEVLAKVDEGPAIGFVLAARDGHHVMMQTKASLEKDIPAVAALAPESILYVDVDSLAEVERSMKDAKDVRVLVPRRTTAYGAHEVFYGLASGHVVGFAEHV